VNPELDAYMQQCMERKFEWGKFDCFTYAAGAVLALTGKDHMADLRGYADETSAEIMLREKFGTLNLRCAFLKVAAIHAIQVPKHSLKDGDICSVKWNSNHYKPTQLDQSTGLAVYWQWRILALHPMGITVIPETHRLIDAWRF
jgi:hypothetical protein